MRVTKTCDIEMVVEENLKPEDMEILCQLYSADVLQSILYNNINRPHYVKYRVKEVNKEVRPIT